MLQNILEQLKNPVTTTIQKSEQEDIQKGIIKLVVISRIISLLNIISSILLTITKVYEAYSIYSSSKVGSEVFYLNKYL